MKKIIFLVFIPFALNAQSFLTTLKFEDSFGNLDSVQVGFDSMATSLIDPIFGEEDIQDIPFGDTLDVRVAQVNLDYLECNSLYGLVNDIEEISELITYVSKTDIAPHHCGEYDFSWGPNEGLYPFTCILINNKDLPVKMTWDSTEFAIPCAGNSLFTDWIISYWWDVVCRNLTIDPTKFTEGSEITISNRTETQIVNQFGDTLSVIYMVIFPDDMVSTQNKTAKENIAIFPNPTSTQLTIDFANNELNSKLLSVYTASGELVQQNIIYDNTSIDVRSWTPGVYYFVFEKDGQRFVKKVIRSGD